MPSTVLTGAYAIFQYSSALNGAQIDELKAGIIPTSSYGIGGWTRLFTSAEDGLTINRESGVLDLKTQEEGLKASVIIDSDVWTMNIPVANIDVATYRDLLQLNPNEYGTTNVTIALNGDYQGFDMLSNGKPILVYHKSYHKSSEGRDTPTLGTGSDPSAWVFTKGGLSDRNMEVSYDPNTQQIQNVVFKFIAVDGTSEMNVLGVYGVLTASTAVSS